MQRPWAEPIDVPGVLRHVLRCWLVAAAIATPATATAQDTREQTITQRQAAKATDLRPYEPNKAEQVLAQLQDTLILSPNGFYPYFDSVYSGGGFTLGAGYRRFIGDRLNWNVNGLYSIKHYKLIEAALHSPRPTTGKVDFNLFTGWRDATEVAYHGLGIHTPRRSHDVSDAAGISRSGRLASATALGRLSCWPDL